MKEMLLVGRGGQGVVLASQILADTFARAGYWVQSFPEFKAERRGAPISAFLRWDEASPIHRRYRVRDCDVLVVVSASPPPAESLRQRAAGRARRPEPRVALRARGPVRDRPRSRLARSPAATASSPRGPADGQRRRARRVRQAARSRTGSTFLEQAIAARMGTRAGANVLAAERVTSACTGSARSPATPPVEPRPAGGRPPRRQARRLPDQHRPTARATTPARGRRSGRCCTGECTACARLRALLPGGRDHEERRLDDGRLPLLQGLRDLRGRLPGPGRDRAWRRCTE